ncbi:MAG: respiratory nitrate reductase subunit gamma [Burkholderiales bacterium]|nr:respiratory nitrate reductase subunit gamma [Burkholderiales bacterium]
MFDVFFFVAFPYIALLLLIGGTIYRAFSGFRTVARGRWRWSARGDLMWTTRSTGFFGRASIGPAALSLHWGILILFLAHIAGVIGGAANWPSWVGFFRWTGLFGGLLLLYGLVWAFIRRCTIAQVRSMSSAEDFIVLLFLIVIAGLGLYHSSVQLAFGVSYAVGPWLVGLFTLQPDARLLAEVSMTMKLHIIIASAFFAYLPFTKLVHLFSFPWSYATRPPISMRSYVGLKK